MNMINTSSGYGLLTILLHWIMAVIIICLFFLGDYMVDLDYYDKWYHTAPWWHKSIGLNLLALLVMRTILRISSPSPAPISTHQSWEVNLAKMAHLSFYFLLFTICISGYFIATAKGAAIEMLTDFYIPAITTLNEDQVDLAGNIHQFAAYLLMILAAMHALAAIKHHIIDHDTTLVRMLGK